MKQRFPWQRIAQCLVVVICALTMKLYYSTASANELRWILAPTTACVEMLCRTSFEFESHAGYMSEDRRFLIANSCAGVNFLITAFVMLSGMRLLRDRTKRISWRVIPIAAAVAYVVTLVANTTRIAIALAMRQTPVKIGWLDQEQLHRFEGIFIYFAFLLLLFVAAERVASKSASSIWWGPFFPVLAYYATVLGIPLANGAYKQGPTFWEHSVFVLLIPLILVLPLASVFIYKRMAMFRSPDFRRKRDLRAA